jgi:hypothetical protein
MIARILGGVCLALVVAVTVQTVSLKRTQAALSASESVRAGLVRDLGAVTAARQTEREQCAQDFAGEVERGKIEVAKAAKAALARSQITGLCPRASTQAERLAALRANSGESKP